VILRNLFRAKAIRADQVIGACCGYLLAGVAWGNLYLLAELLRPASFRVSPEIAWQLADEHARRFLFNYFSFATLTTLGYAEVTLLGPAAATLTWLELGDTPGRRSGRRWRWRRATAALDSGRRTCCGRRRR
jgi:hypothetical protein